jgi:hypothetical protein
MATLNAYMIVPIECVQNWWTIHQIVENYHGMKMGQVFGISLDSKDGIGKIRFVGHPTLETAGVFVCGQQLI